MSGVAIMVHYYPALKAADVKVPKAACTSRLFVTKRWRVKNYAGGIGADWYVYTFVRHPLDRLVSLYHNQYERRYRGKGSRFEKFARDVFQGVLGRDRHWLPQTFITDQFNLDFIGRFENLAEDWKVIQDRFGFNDLPVRNSSTHKPWREYYDDALLNDAVSYYQKDFEEFGYLAP